METDKHYFFEGLFVIGFMAAAAFFFVWLGTSGHRDDVLYRIYFAESVSGLAVGDAVKYRGVDIGSVRAMAIDSGDPRLVQIDVKLRKDAPIKTDTRASLRMRGITGAVFVELSGGNPNSKSLLAATPEGEVPVIPWEKSTFNAFFDELPKVIRKFSGLETQTQKVISDIGEVTEKVKEDPSLLLRGPRKKESATNR
jgi:phospholipid/cholesterol/gamma-HCH transport system substrate-binding protein